MWHRTSGKNEDVSEPRTRFLHKNGPDRHAGCENIFRVSPPPGRYTDLPIVRPLRRYPPRYDISPVSRPVPVNLRGLSTLHTPAKHPDALLLFRSLSQTSTVLCRSPGETNGQSSSPPRVRLQTVYSILPYPHTNILFPVRRIQNDSLSPPGNHFQDYSSPAHF